MIETISDLNSDGTNPLKGISSSSFPIFKVSKSRIDLIKNLLVYIPYHGNE